MLLVLGVIDVGQYANVYQKVSDASREGARVAARYNTATTSQVESAVRTYLKQVTRGASAAAFASSAQITVSNADGSAIPGGDLTKCATGSQIDVRVKIGYEPVRWISGFKGLDGKQLEATTSMRRE
jgi:Flp pilus assembly protein TadG